MRMTGCPGPDMASRSLVQPAYLNTNGRKSQVIWRMRRRCKRLNQNKGNSNVGFPYGMYPPPSEKTLAG